MTKEEEIKKLEEEIWDIFRKDYIPRFLALRGTNRIEKWKFLTGWETDKTFALEKPLPILDDNPNY
jgi:hypothetical protein